MQEKKQSLVPELRFPGFEGEWPIQPLSKFLHEHKTKSDGKCRVHSVSVSKGVVDQIEYLGRSFAASDTSKYNLAKPNDIIYTKSPTGSFPYGIVKMNKNPYNVIVSPLYGVYSPTNKYIGYIIDSFFESPERTNTYLSTLVQKGAKNTIQVTNNTFISKNVCFPTDEAEQQKIAECLSSVDHLIQEETDQLQALKDHKKGLIQQLFPQEGETTPKLRFPGVKGEWEEKKFNDIFSLLSNNTCSRAEMDNNIGVALNVHYGDILTKYNEILDVQKTNIPYVTDNDLLVKYKDSFLQDGDIIISDTAEDSTVGKCTEIQNHQEIIILSGLHTIPVRPQRKFAKGYLGYFLNSESYHNQLLPLMQGAKVSSISRTAIKKTEIFFPSLPEQQKIAECLSSLDEGIAVQQQKVEALKEHKKGLMQKLFPTIN